MTPLNFAIVGLRLMGIYFIITSGAFFSMAALAFAFLEQIAQGPGISQSATLVSSMIPGTTMVVLGILLFVFAVPLAKRIVPISSVDSEKSALSLSEVQATAFAAVGVLILTDALPSLVRVLENLYYWFYYQQEYKVRPPPHQFDLFYSIGIVVQVIIGLVLVLSPQGFRNIWHWLRTAGTQPKE